MNDPTEARPLLYPDTIIPTDTPRGVAFIHFWSESVDPTKALGMTADIHWKTPRHGDIIASPSIYESGPDDPVGSLIEADPAESLAIWTGRDMQIAARKAMEDKP